MAFSALMLLVGRQEGQKTEWWGAGVVVCLEWGADLHIAQLMPLPLIVSCFSKIQIGFTFLVPAYLGSPGQRAVKRVCVCVCPPDFNVNIYRTDLNPIRCDDRTVAADERSEVSLSIPRGTLPWQPISWVGEIDLQSTCLTWVLVPSARSRRAARSVLGLRVQLLHAAGVHANKWPPFDGRKRTN